MRMIRAALLLALLLAAPLGRADWINLTGAETAPNIAEIYVMDDHVRLVLEVYIGDLDKFDELVPDAWFAEAGANRPSLEQRMQTFAAQRFQFVTDAGEVLQARLELVEARLRVDRKSPFAGMINPITRQRVPEAPVDKRVLYAEIVYPFEGKPEELTIKPPLDTEGRTSAAIGFIAYHKAVPIIDFRYLGESARVALDWEDPWYTKFDNPNLKRHHKSALMTFLYVEPYEVRHEVLIRVRDLEQWMDLELKGNKYIEVDELEPLKQRIGEFMLTKNPTHVDGQALKPILDRTNYIEVSVSGIRIIEKPARLDLSTAIIGVIITYLTNGIPREVTVDWELFNDQIERVPATAIDPAGPLLGYLEPQDNVHKWTNFLKNYKLPTVEQVALDESLTTFEIPVASVVCLLFLIPVIRLWKTRSSAKDPQRSLVVIGALLVVGSVALYPFARMSVAKPAQFASTLNDDDTRIVIQSLLKNVYRAFDFREEDDVYDKLALSVNGDLLTDVYLQSRKSLQVQKAGGAQAKVKEVEVQEVTVHSRPDRPLAYTFKAKWTALGTVGHWGHIHTRKNLYDALVTVDAVDSHWKITGLKLFSYFLI